MKETKSAYEVLDVIKERRSPRVFSAKEVTEDDLFTLFEAARWAASSMNEQPWRFMYTRRGSDAHEKIMDCLAPFNQQWVGNAPVLIITAYKEHFESGKENFHALHDLGLAMGNLSLQAQSMNIAVHHMAGINWKKIQEVFGVDEGFHVSTAVAIGYYGGDISVLPEDLQESEQGKRKRNSIDSFVAEDQWIEG